MRLFADRCMAGLKAIKSNTSILPLLLQMHPTPALYFPVCLFTHVLTGLYPSPGRPVPCHGCSLREMVSTLFGSTPTSPTVITVANMQSPFAPFFFRFLV